MGAYPPPRREPGGVRQARRESVLSARREASVRLVRDQLDQQQLARVEQLSIISSEEEELADEKRLQRATRHGVILPTLCSRMRVASRPSRPRRSVTWSSPSPP